MADPLLAQMQEVEALQAIYGDDFTERAGVWNRRAFAIRIHPPGLEEGVTAFVVLTVKVCRHTTGSSFLVYLPSAHSSQRITHTHTHTYALPRPHIQYTQAYPKTPPLLSLSDRRGFSEAEEEELLQLLVKRSQELVGDVMVFDLILVAEEFLVQKTRRQSAYDEMRLREEAEQRRREEERRAEEEAARWGFGREADLRANLFLGGGILTIK